MFHVVLFDSAPANGIAGADRVHRDAASGRAQPGSRERSDQSCTNCTLYARTELNLRQGPSLDAAVLRFIPAGAPVHRTTGAESNGYAPVTYDGVSGWAVALGLVATPEEIDAAAAPSDHRPRRRRPGDQRPRPPVRPA